MSQIASDTQTPDFRRHVRALLALGVPLVGSHLAQFAITLTDSVMMGRYGVAELAALVLAGSFFFILFIIGSGFAGAVMPMVAAHIAADERTQVRRVTRMGLWLSILFGLIVMPLMLFSESLFLSLGQKPETARLAGQYLQIACLGLIPALLVMVLKSYLAALERTGVVFWVTVVAAVMNAVVNYALIFGNWGFPELGVRGAAIASVLVQLLSVVALVIYVNRVTPEFALFQRFWRPDWDAFFKVARLGTPIGLTLLAEVGLFTATNVLAGWLGTVELAAHGIALQITSLFFMVHIGLSQAATIRAGQFFGNKNFAAVRGAALASYFLSGLFALFSIFVFLTFPEPLIAFYVDVNDPALPQIMAFGVMLLALAALFQVVDAIQVMTIGLLRGLQDTRGPMVIAAFSYWAVGAPAAYILAFPVGLDLAGIWLGLVVGLTCAGLLLLVRFIRQIR